MADIIILDDTEIKLKQYESKETDGLHEVSFTFDVTSEEYHDIAVLLYRETFDVNIPEEDLKFRGTITNYSTSLDNLYEENQTGEFRVTLQEVEA
ncbi:DUF3219 family protein [Salinicoccus hispanicus]|uniref:DUF3219 family protein n=1 Tax=Salinicoccus hispanicus TaxID=157225 RepID=A0A6N8U211_9STAP|nr:DUF3219 family protein [Salinicoccus hispanicus]MXQ51822.1 DUF3219 family protein [Salinicoccus hispanicus]